MRPRVVRVMTGVPAVQGLGVDAAGERAYLVSEPQRRGRRGNGTVRAIDVSDGSEVFRVEVDREPRSVAVHPDGDRIYVAGLGGTTLKVLDATTGDELDVIALARPGAAHVCLSVDGRFAYVTNPKRRCVDVVDLVAGAVVDELAAGEGARSATVGADGDALFVANAGAGTVDVFRLPGGAHLATLAVGAGPQKVAVSPVGRWAYTADRWSWRVTVIDVEALAVVDAIPLTTLSTRPRLSSLVHVPAHPEPEDIAVGLGAFAVCPMGGGGHRGGGRPRPAGRRGRAGPVHRGEAQSRALPRHQRRRGKVPPGLRRRHARLDRLTARLSAAGGKIDNLK